MKVYEITNLREYTNIRNFVCSIRNFVGHYA